MARRKGPRSPDAAIAVIASRQYGVLARRQLLSAGVGEAAIDHRLGTVLHPVHAGVYAVGHDRLTTEGRWLAAVLACGPGAALSHRAAAALRGLRHAWTGYLEVSARRSVKGVAGVIVHRPRQLDRTLYRGIPVTPVGRTIVDIADVVSARTLRSVLERAEILRLDGPAVPVPGRRGYGRLVAALAEHGPVVTFTRSELEEAFLEVCRVAGVPKPRMNTVIEGMEVDAAWPELRVAVEIDSWKYHGTRTAYQRDRRRSTTLQLAGWSLVRFTDVDIEHDRAYVVVTVRALVA
jgi:very-short-patch-repair endonuclease